MAGGGAVGVAGSAGGGGTAAGAVTGAGTTGGGLAAGSWAITLSAALVSNKKRVME